MTSLILVSACETPLRRGFLVISEKKNPCTVPINHNNTTQGCKEAIESNFIEKYITNYYEEAASTFGDIDSYRGRYVLLPTRYQDGTDTVPNAPITEHNGTRNLTGTEKNQTEQNQKEGTLTKIERNVTPVR